MKKSLKYYIASLIIIIIAITPIYAEVMALNDTVTVEIQGEVVIIPYEVNIYYNGEILRDTEFRISNKYDLTVPNRTEIFSIFVSGNQPTGLSLTVTIVGQQFRRQPLYDSKEIVTDFYVNAIEILGDENLNNLSVSAEAQNFSSTFAVEGNLSNEIQNNPNVINFVLAWVGNDKLPAGEYTSDINIVYSVDS